MEDFHSISSFAWNPGHRYRVADVQPDVERFDPFGMGLAVGIKGAARFADPMNRVLRAFAGGVAVTGDEGGEPDRQGRGSPQVAFLEPLLRRAPENPPAAVLA